MDNNKNPFEKEPTAGPESSNNKRIVEDYRRKESEGIVPGIILIAIGGLWLLSKFNYINFSFSNLVRSFVDLWPLILVVAGVNLIFKRQRFVHGITWLLFLAVLLFYSTFGPTFFGDKFGIFGSNHNGVDSVAPGPAVSESVAKPTQGSGKQMGIESASFSMEQYTPAPKTGNVELNLAAGDVFIGSDSDNLVSYVIPATSMKEKTVNVSGEHAKLVFNESDQFPGVHKGSSFNFYLGSEVAWKIQSNSGAVDGNFDLENVNVESFQLNTGAGDVKLTLGDLSKLTKVEINGAATDVALDVPQDSGLKIKMSSVVKDNNLASKGLVKDGDYYMTPNYKAAENKIDVNISTAVSDIQLDRH